jgi:integrase
MPRLTKRLIDAACTPGFIWDDEIRGLGLHVGQGGSKSYVLNYRAGRGRNAPQRRLTIGKHGSPWTPVTVRPEAIRLLGLVAGGEDPAIERRAATRGMTVNELCDLYLREGCHHKKASSLVADTGRIRNHIVPLLGNLRVDRIQRVDVERMVRDISAGRTAAPASQPRRQGNVAKGGAGTATQALSVLSAIMTFAVGRGLRDDNPTRGIKRRPARRIERFLSELELARLGEALTAEAETTGDPFPTAAIRLLLLTGARRNEIADLQWSWLDLQRSMIFLPDSKTGKKPIYLSPAALQVLAELPRIEGNPHVIVGHRDGQAYAALNKVWARVREAAGLKGTRLHDLRHSYASVAAAGGNSLLVIGKLLGHQNVLTTERYAHLSSDPLRAATDRIGERIATALAGKGEAGSDNVERLRGRG